ncbi:MAG: hypothetical protein IVW55_08700 [Chloroflexi bacterium]|nr:hypothetical protein [Chloroflexota bacterium]
MVHDHLSGGSSARRTLSLVVIVLGALLLLSLPVVLVVLAFGQEQNVRLPGTLVIISAAGGMALLVIGAALRE